MCVCAVVPFDGGMYLVDTTNKDAGEAMFEGFWEGYGRYGFKAVWNDAAEPERTSDTFGKFQMEKGTDTEIGEAWVQQV